MEDNDMKNTTSSELHKWIKGLDQQRKLAEDLSDNVRFMLAKMREEIKELKKQFVKNTPNYDRGNKR